jgi:SAM-dependent methyltransferase
MAMFTHKRCPVCESADVELIDQITPQALIDAYRTSGLVQRTTHLFTDLAQPVMLCGCRSCSLKWYAHGPAGDAAFYEDLQRHDWYYQNDKPEHVYAGSCLGVAPRVLEVGCGGGAFARHMPDGATYRGLEFNQLAVQTARAAGLDVEVRGLEQEAQSQAGVYDVVCHFQVLEHVTDPAGFMRLCAQALKPGGRMIVAVPAEDSFYGLAESVFLNMPPHHLTRWTDRALATVFRQAGVEPTHFWHEPVADFHQDWQRGVAMRAGWQNLFGSQPQLMISPVSQKLMNLLRWVPGLDDWLYRRGLAAYPDMARGSTVCVVGTKTEAGVAAGRGH